MTLIVRGFAMKIGSKFGGLTWRIWGHFAGIFPLIGQVRECESWDVNLGYFCFPFAYDLTWDTCYNLNLCMCVSFAKIRSLNEKKSHFSKLFSNQNFQLVPRKFCPVFFTSLGYHWHVLASYDTWHIDLSCMRFHL